jgi:hypothetical protein
LPQSSWHTDDILVTAPDMLVITFKAAVPQLSSTKPFPSLSFPSPHTSVEPIKGLISGEESLAKEILFCIKTNKMTNSM